MSASKKNNSHLIGRASEEEMKNFNISKHLLDFLWSEPFYSRILRSLDKIETARIPTAGVSSENGDLVLWWNRKFLAGLTDIQVKGLLKHECLHLVFGHTTERRLDPHLVWNYGTDLAINSTIPFHELPEGGFYPGRPLPELSSEQIKNMDKDQVETYEKFSNLIESLPINKTSEFYFNKLMEDPTIQEEIEKEKENSNSIITNLGFDDHDGWENIPEEEKEQIAAKVKELVKEAAAEASERGWGSMPANTIHQIQKMLSREIKWEDLLKRFCGFSRRNERISSIKRLNRKYPNIHPGAKKQYKPMIALYIDESGSVSDAELAKFYTEIDSLSNRTDFYLYRFDTEVDSKNGFLWKKNKRHNLPRGKCGGTCFEAVTKHAIENRSKFDGYIILTDGCAPKPKISKGIKRCWILPNNCNLAFQKDKNDILIKMKNTL